MFNTRQAVVALRQMSDVAQKLRKLPQLVPIAQEMFAPIFGTNGTAPATSRKRTMSAATRRKIAKASKARWARQRREGK